MKTNQVMLRDDYFVQRTKDSYFNATLIITKWNALNTNKKLLGNYTKLDSTSEYIEQLKKEGIETPIITGRGKGDNAGTWMHPYLFVDFVMWVSVEFKSKVIRYVVDGLIRSRHEAGDYYNEMSAIVLEQYVKKHNCKPSPFIYINEAKMIKELSGVDKARNELSEIELNRITVLQKVNSTLLIDGVGLDSRKKQLAIVARSI